MDTNLILHILLYLFYLTLFLLAIHKWKFFDAGINRKYVTSFFGLKVLAGVALTLIYTYYYTDQAKADIYRYFNDSKIVSQLLFTHPSAWLQIITGTGMHDAKVFVYMLPTQNFSHSGGDFATSNSFIIRVISVLNYFSFRNIYIDTLFFNFISFTGLVMLYKTFKPYLPNTQQLLLVPLFLLPSVIFWGSGLLKEPLLLFGLGLYIYSLSKWQLRNQWQSVLWAIAGILIIGWLKVYIAAILLVCSVFLPTPISITKRRWVLQGLVIGAVVGFAVNDHLCEKVIDKRNEFISLSITENAGSTISNTTTDATCSSLASLIVTCLPTAIFRPFVWEKGKIFQLIFAAENMLLWLLLLYLLFRYFKQPEIWQRGMFLFCISFALFNYLVIGLTVTVFGAVVHYRIVAEIFMVIALFLFIDDRISIKLKKYRFE